MRKLLLSLAIGLSLLTSQSFADFTFPTFTGPFNVTDAGFTLDVNDAANSAGITSGEYGTFTLTTDWVAGGGGPWSSEAEILFTTSAGSVEIDPPTAGGSNSVDPTTLTFSGGFADLFDPDIDGFIEVSFDQSFAGSDADWSNVSITLEDFVVPDTPTVGASLTSTQAGASHTESDYGSGEVVWVEVLFDGIGELQIDTEGSTSADGQLDTEIGLYNANGFLVGSDDDGGTDLLSSATFANLSAGTYYAAASTFNTAFGTGFNVTTTGTEAGSLSINVMSIVAVPEPGSFGALALLSLGIFVRRRR